MKVMKNGVTIDTKVMYRGWRLIKISDSTSAEKITLTERGIDLLEQFLSGPKPAEDTRAFHYETFHWVENEKNMRYYCKKCHKQFLSAKTFDHIQLIPLCKICETKLSDIFNYENKIYE